MAGNLKTTLESVQTTANSAYNLSNHIYKDDYKPFPISYTYIFSDGANEYQAIIRKFIPDQLKDSFKFPSYVYTDIYDMNGNELKRDGSLSVETLWNNTIYNVIKYGWNGDFEDIR